MWFDGFSFIKVKITKNRYLVGFTTIVLILAVVRLIFPSVAKDRIITQTTQVDSTKSKKSDGKNSQKQDFSSSRNEVLTAKPITFSPFFDNKGKTVKNRINSVPGFSATFPDNNDVQLTAANKYGVEPVENRQDAENRKKELVYVGANPYFYVDKLRNSIPYLVPRAATLLNNIGRAYYDSLQIKGIPLHQIIVTSVLRSREDVNKLRGHNGNATENSCHLYGTTFDICYNRYKTVADPNGKQRRTVRNDTLKWVLSEVMRDLREKGKCYVKYEVKQGCFHITVR